MTLTDQPRRTRDTPERAPSRVEADYTSTRRTLLALLASGIGILPLKSLFSDISWVLDVWISMLVVIGPAALIRLRRAPGALDIWPGIALLVPWLTVRFVHVHAFAGFLPTSRTWDDLSALMTSLHKTTRDEVAPIHTTVAVKLVVCALLGLLAALIDLIAVVGRRGALAGVPLLVIFTVAGAVPRKPVSWLWFTFAAAAYLILLALDASDDLQHWGRRVKSNSSGRTRSALSVSTPRIAVAAVVAAVVLPLLVPGSGRNLIANAFHGGNGSGVGSFGGSGGGKISPFVALKGQLNQKNPTTLATVTMLTNGGATAPFYLRLNVLSRYTGAGWGVADHGDTSSIDTDEYPTVPSGATSDSVSMRARIQSTGFDGVNPPVFTVPTSISGLAGSTTWSTQDQLLLGSELHKGDSYVVSFSQPAPTTDQLERAPDNVTDSVRSQLEVPPDLSQYVKNLVADLTKDVHTPYGRARALNDYFVDPANGFSYDLTTAPGDTSDDLVNFLQGRRGYCQQYAAAMAIMLRAADVPARVVLGYMHPVADANGKFTIKTSDAHSWVEAYFSGIGWIPFDPTPASGLTDGGKSDLAWAPHSVQSRPTASASATNVPRASAKNPGASSAAASTAPAASNKSGTNVPGTAAWLATLVVIVLVAALAPATLRWIRRRRRYLAARRDGDTDAVWSELSDTATDLGYVWSSARSPRQVAAWLAEQGAGASGSLQTLADAVEHHRYAPAAPASDGAGLAHDLREVTGGLRAGRSGRERLRATFWPASLGWTNRFGGRRGH